MSMREILQKCQQAFQNQSSATAEDRVVALNDFADRIIAKKDFLLKENAKDLQEQEGKISNALYQRLKLDSAKVDQLARGMRDLASMKDPVGQVEWRRKLDDNLILEKIQVPLGVVGIIFESRPDVIPQILSLVLKSGNAAVLKGGKEALHSNRAFMTIVAELTKEHAWLSEGWAALIETRDDVDAMLQFPEYISLVIPRGSNELVRSVMERTKIPVLGHADGICHVYVDRSADQEQALQIVLDSKSQYPSACNAMETLLVDLEIAGEFLPKVESMAKENGLKFYGCEQTRTLLPEVAAAENWSMEFGELVFNLKVVDGLDKAIQHINTYGSHHTDAIVTKSEEAQDKFSRAVDSACVFANASTRFADGFRFGMGAEVGISTAKTHARGPVGIDGLMIYKYKLHGDGQVAATYCGPKAKAFLHEDIS